MAWESVRLVDHQLQFADSSYLPGPVLVDVLTNPDDISVPGKIKLEQAWGFAIAKMRETVLSQGDS